MNYEITEIRTSRKLEVIWRNFYNGTPKFLVTNYDSPYQNGSFYKSFG